VVWLNKNQSEALLTHQQTAKSDVTNKRHQWCGQKTSKISSSKNSPDIN